MWFDFQLHIDINRVDVYGLLNLIELLFRIALPCWFIQFTYLVLAEYLIIISYHRLRLILVQLSDEVISQFKANLLHVSNTIDTHQCL